MTCKYSLFFLILCVAHAAAFRIGIGGRIAIYPRTSQGSRMSKIIKYDWNCDPFTNCKYNDFPCMLEKCPFNAENFSWQILFFGPGTRCSGNMQQV